MPAIAVVRRARSLANENSADTESETGVPRRAATRSSKTRAASARRARSAFTSRESNTSLPGAFTAAASGPSARYCNCREAHAWFTATESRVQGGTRRAGRRGPGAAAGRGTRLHVEERVGHQPDNRPRVANTERRPWTASPAPRVVSPRGGHRFHAGPLTLRLQPPLLRAAARLRRPAGLRAERLGDERHEPRPRRLAVLRLRAVLAAVHDEHAVTGHAAACERRKARLHVRGERRGDVEAQLHGRGHLVHVLPARARRAHEAFLVFVRRDDEAGGDGNHGVSRPRRGTRERPQVRPRGRARTRARAADGR